MIVIISEDIIEGIKKYAKSLKKEPYLISNETRLKKVSLMCSYICSLEYLQVKSICTHTQLGQVKDKKGNSLDKELKQFIYEDEGSKSKWTFSYTIDDINGIVNVLKMKFSSHLKDSKTKVRYPFLTGLLEYRNKTMA